MFNRIKGEPVIFWGLLEGVAIATVGLLALFDVVSLTEAQTGGVLLFFAALGAVFAFLVRGQVTALVAPMDNDGNALVPAMTGGTVPPPASDDAGF